MTRVYDEIVDRIAGGMTPDEVVAWQPSAEAKEQVAELVRRAKAGAITDEEREELDHYMEIEHLMRLAKARARQRRAGERE